MRSKSEPNKPPAEAVTKEIRRHTRKHYGAEEKIRIVLEGLRGDDSIAELCHREGLNQNLSLVEGFSGGRQEAVKHRRYWCRFRNSSRRGSPSMWSPPACRSRPPAASSAAST